MIRIHYRADAKKINVSQAGYGRIHYRAGAKKINVSQAGCGRRPYARKCITT